jgi:hypothetical protein
MGDIWEAFGKHLGPQAAMELQEAQNHKNRCPSHLKRKSSFEMLILLRVFESQITKHCKLQVKMLAGSRQRSARPTKAPLPTPPGPLQINLFGEKWSHTRIRASCSNVGPFQLTLFSFEFSWSARMAGRWSQQPEKSGCFRIPPRKQEGSHSTCHLSHKYGSFSFAHY